MRLILDVGKSTNRGRNFAGIERRSLGERVELIETVRLGGDKERAKAKTHGWKRRAEVAEVVVWGVDSNNDKGEPLSRGHTP